jgi:hypothetical protein
MRSALFALCFGIFLLSGCQKSTHSTLQKSGRDYTYLSGETYTDKKVYYEAREGLAFVEGDIVLGTIEEMESRKRQVEEGGDSQGAIAITSKSAYWPDGKVYYTIDSELPDKERVTNAIKNYEENTRIRFFERKDEKNFITFRHSEDSCSSIVGMKGGEQFINLKKNCGTGSTIHEIGHALGLWHEQSRKDRDKFVKILWDNISADNRFNFNQHLNDGKDIAEYDYDSIMHYSSQAFSKNGKPTITKLDGTTDGLGNRQALSEMDIAGIEILYSSGQ